MIEKNRKSRLSGIHRAACLRIEHGRGTIFSRDRKWSGENSQTNAGSRMEKEV